MSEDKKQNGAPEGFDVNVGRQLGDGWVKKGPGVTIQGRLLGRFIGTQKDDDGVYQAFYQIRLAVTCPATQKDKETQIVKDITLQAGQIVNVGEHKAIEDLAPKTSDGGIYDVWFRYVKQDKVQGTRRTFWVMDGPKLKVIKAPTHAPIPMAVKRGSPTDQVEPSADENPFND